MKRYLMAFALVGLLSVSAMGGDISTSGSPAPGSSGTTSSASPSPGDIPTVGMPAQVSGDALSAILSVLSLLTR